MEIVQEKSMSEMCSHIVKCKKGPSLFHWHEKYEICQIIKHSCHMFVDGKYIEAQEGDIIVFKNLAVHRFLIDTEDTYIRIIQFPANTLLNVSNNVKPLKTHISRKEIDNNPLLREKLDHIFKLLDKEGNICCSSDNPYLRSLLSTLYFLLMRDFAVEEEGSSVKKDRRTFFKIVEYVNEHFKEDINVTKVAANLYISRGYLTLLLTKYSGSNLKEYINILRIKNVNKMLADGYSVTEAALESGFQSIRTFNYTYKACMGITPAEYVKKNVKKGS